MDEQPLKENIWNIPNQLTVARLILAVVCFCFLSFGSYWVALILFAIAAGTDWMDGYWARRYNQLTKLGRILDPFADKFIICGVFIFLAAIPQSGIEPWMAVLVVARELLVTGLRSFFEQSGVDFSASMPGKLKMVFQCGAVLLSLYRLTFLEPGTEIWATEPSQWLSYSLTAFVWLAIVMTVYSGWGYVMAALRLLRSN